MTSMLDIVVNFGLIYILGFFIGLFNRKNIHFGVTFKSKHIQDEKLTTLRGQYTKIYGLVGGCIMLIFAYFTMNFYSAVLYVVYVVLWLIGIVFLYTYFNRKAKEIKEALYSNEVEKKKIVVSASLKDKNIEVPNIGIHFLMPLIIVFMTIGLTIVFWNNIPEQIPMHYNSVGEITRYEEKSIFTVGLMPFMQVFLALILFGSTYVSVKYSRRKLNSKKPHVSEVQYNIAMRRFSIMMAFITGILNLQFLTLHVIMIQGLMVNAILFSLIIYGSIILILMPLAWFFITTGMTGEKVKVDFDEPELDVEEEDDDEYWIWGMIYYNKNDASVFVPKRFGGGLTINIATKGGMIFMVAILFIILISVGLPFVLS